MELQKNWQQKNRVGGTADIGTFLSKVESAQSKLADAMDDVKEAKRRLKGSIGLADFDPKEERKMAEVRDALKNWSIDVRVSLGLKR